MGWDGLECEVTRLNIPDGWAKVQVQKHGERERHYCAKCWTVGVVAMVERRA